MVDEIEKKTLVLMLFSEPYGNQDALNMCRIAKKALEKNYNVEIFLYGDGVYAQMKNQAPKLFFNIGEALKNISINGAIIKSCIRCSKARGFNVGDFDSEQDRYPSQITLDEVKIYSLYGFINMIKKADKILTFGST